jgi:hypothetical protein
MSRPKILIGVLIVITLIISLSFNFRLVKDVFWANFRQYPTDDGNKTEFLLETSRQNLLQYKNPFITHNTILYPYGLNYVLDDHWITSIPILTILRLGLDIHRSLIVLLLINFLVTCLLMYFTLRKLSVDPLLAWIGSLVFTFTPFLGYQTIGHFTYITMYLFPLIFLAVYNFIYAKQTREQLLWSILGGLILVFSLLTNFYYFLSIMIALLCLFIYFLLTQRKALWSFVCQRLFFLLLSAISIVIVLIPWAITVRELLLFDGLVNVPGFGGAIDLSADLTSFFIPSVYNPIYRSALNKLSSLSLLTNKLNHFYLRSWSTFAYPGVLVLISYFAFFRLKKKLPVKIIKSIEHYFWVGLFFGLLMLGPFLKIFNRWYFPADDGINVYLPLPFLLLHYLPGFSTIRAPTRFTPAFVFFGVIVGSLLANYLLKKINLRRRLMILLLVMTVFIVDQFHFTPVMPTQEVPIKAYEYISHDLSQVTVLEIPFTVRDGLQYIGSVHSTSFIKGILIHHKPVIGGYPSRVYPWVFKYYQELPFIGHIAKIIDKGNYLVGKEEPGQPQVTPFTDDSQKLEDEVDFLAIKYVLLKNNEDYSAVIGETISKMNFRPVLQDGNYRLWQRTPISKNFSTINFSMDDDYLYLGANFSLKEDGFRWALGKRAKVFIKLPENLATNSFISFKLAAYHQSQSVRVYLDEKLLGNLDVVTTPNSYQLPIPSDTPAGLHRLDFIMSQSFRPSEVGESQDQRDLSIKFYQISLSNQR